MGVKDEHLLVLADYETELSGESEAENENVCEDKTVSSLYLFAHQNISPRRDLRFYKCVFVGLNASAGRRITVGVCIVRSVCDLWVIVMSWVINLG